MNSKLNNLTNPIEIQKAKEQINFVNSVTLPVKHIDSWEVLTKWGIQKGKPVDDLFCKATLPIGWNTVSTDHSMWSKLLDNKNRMRGMIFYKGVYYDRDAFINVREHEFSLNGYVDRKDFNQQTGHQCGVEDSLGNIVFTNSPVEWGVMDNQLGVCYKEIFYSKPKKKLWKTEYTFKNQTPINSSLKILSNREFYDNYHHKSPEYELIELAKELAQKKSLEVAAEMNSKSDWYSNVQ